jgi:ArsR family transcriptional regulator, arsenate/arsenite/antimonite-responsive transcriptional repressor
MSKGTKSFSIEQFFRALADNTRLRVLNLLGDDEVCVCFLAEILQANQPSISRHLAYLKRVGIVDSRREGKWMHYRIVEPPDAEAAQILCSLRRRLTQDKEMQRDRKRLVKVCCSVELPDSLQGAPKPASVSTEDGLAISC